LGGILVDDLYAVLAKLNSKQRLAINKIVEIEQQNIPLSYYLKMRYNCLGCGQVIGNSTNKRHQRLLLLQKHKQKCQKFADGWEHPFICSRTIFYDKWMKNDDFKAALELARNNAIKLALQQAKHIIQISTVDAARELSHQISNSDKTSDRRAAAIAILDRSEISQVETDTSNEDDWFSAIDDYEQETDI